MLNFNLRINRYIQINSNMTHFITTLLIVSIQFFAIPTIAQTNCSKSIIEMCSESEFNKFLPISKKNLETVSHSAYTLGYFEQHEQASWVAYVLSSNECKGEEERSSYFYVDPKVKTGTANNADYKSSGYDRGHLAPAGDMGSTAETMKESFFYSNMSPQVPGFNRGIWKKLETQVRNWAIEYSSCYVITGPFFYDSITYKTIGSNQVSVPQLYYKIVVNPNINPPEAIAFVMNNESSTSALSNFIVTIDVVEKMTGLDFFAALNDNCESALENHVNGKLWSSMNSKMIPE